MTAGAPSAKRRLPGRGSQAGPVALLYHPRREPQLGIISVKGGGTNYGHVRDLKGTMERENAKLGVFPTLNPPTREMEKEAASAGLYDSGGGKMPRLQILTAAEVIDGKRPQVPFGHTESLKTANRETEDRQGRLL